jgi:heptosyltransferase III
MTEDRKPKIEDRRPIDWGKVKRVLVVRLRSIGDTVLSTPSLIALKRFLPQAEIDVLLEDWVAPVLEGFDAADKIITYRKDDLRSRFAAARTLRRRRYDVAFNLHGGSTSTFFTRASGAPHRVGYAHYRYNYLYNHLLTSSADFWERESTHSAEQQLALLGAVGVPVADRPKSRLGVTAKAQSSIAEKLRSGIENPNSRIALMHPAAAFATKQWATESFARTVEFLSLKGLRTVAVAARHERAVLENLQRSSPVPVLTFDDLSLPEIAALAARAEVFVGNDSGIAHIAAAVQTPTVVIFGSSNINHWRPWTDAPNEIVYREIACRPCAGYSCAEFDVPRCILGVEPEKVFAALERILKRQDFFNSQPEISKPK